MEVMKMIKIQVNNGESLEIRQYEGNINVETKESNYQISEGDFVMLLNYYQYIKSNNIQCDFINPNGTRTE
jgi:hypothetical protein